MMCKISGGRSSRQRVWILGVGFKSIVSNAIAGIYTSGRLNHLQTNNWNVTITHLCFVEVHVLSYLLQPPSPSGNVVSSPPAHHLRILDLAHHLREFLLFHSQVPKTVDVENGNASHDDLINLKIPSHNGEGLVTWTTRIVDAYMVETFHSSKEPEKPTTGNIVISKWRCPETMQRDLLPLENA